MGESPAADQELGESSRAADQEMDESPAADQELDKSSRAADQELGEQAGNPKTRLV